MKIKYLVIAMLGLVLSSCGGNAPEAVVKEFFAAVAAKDFDKAKSLATTESSSMIGMMEKAAEFATEEEAEESKAVVKVECITEGDKGDCTCWGENGEDEQKVSVKKVDGKWKVHMSKQSMMNDAMKGMGDDMSGAMDKLKDVDLDKAMENFSNEIDSINVDLTEDTANISSVKANSSKK